MIRSTTIILRVIPYCILYFTLFIDCTLSKNIHTRKPKILDSKLLKKFVPAEHPTWREPMLRGVHNYRTFWINKIRHPNCRLKENTFKVVKSRTGRDVQFDQGVTIEFQALKEQFDATNPDHVDEIYNYQMGYITCTPGWIDDVRVHSMPTNARDCGISTVLTELCLLEPEIYVLHQPPDNRPSKSIQYLLQQGYAHELFDIENSCNYLIGMWMKAEPMSGAFAYLGAANRMGYRRLYLETAAGGFFYFWVKDALNSYDENTGKFTLMGECCCDDCDTEHRKCDGFGGRWFFCREN